MLGVGRERDTPEIEIFVAHRLPVTTYLEFLHIGDDPAFIGLYQQGLRREVNRCVSVPADKHCERSQLAIPGHAATAGNAFQWKLRKELESFGVEKFRGIGRN